jgi:prepilin-type N-terminal cleavage/methylation domain-containing protein
MKGHTQRHGRRDAGFSFVELLVTIIIAGIAFAALVPVFVGAQKASSGDLVRNAALQLAQDKLEKIRGLDYDLIEQAALTNNTLPNNMFGTDVTWATGGGGERQFTVAYNVDLIDKNGNAGAADGSESYKQVTITVGWPAPPSPVKPVVLSTMVSKQYSGPRIIKLDLGPSDVLSTDSTTSKTTIVGGPLEIDAYIAPDNILGMNQAAAEAERGYVLFTITSLNGVAVASQKVTQPVDSVEPAHYRFSWDNLSAPNGIYVIQAVAVAGAGSRTQGVPWSLALEFVNSLPPAPTNLAALPGDGSVILTWTTAATGGVDRYEVYRSTDGVSFEHIGDATTTTSYTDTAVTNGTMYYYKVRTIDTAGATSPFTAAVTATPGQSGDTTPPSVPSPLVATVFAGRPTVSLIWAASSDVGSPASGLAGYIVERQKSGSATWETLQTLYEDTVYDDTTAGWLTTWTYRVRAVDVAGNQSANATAGPVTTGAPIPRQIVVTNNGDKHTYVWVQNVATGEWYTRAGVVGYTTRPDGVQVKANKNNTATWISLPGALYNVYFMPSKQFNMADLLKSQVVNVSNGDGTAAYP